jgi:sulfate adenylyltransferase
MRLASGRLWPIPVVLDVTEDFAAGLSPGTRVALRDAEGSLLAALSVRDIWRPDRRAEAAAVYGVEDPAHPGVRHLLERTGSTYLGGETESIRLPHHYDFVHLRATPSELRAEFARLGWRRVVAFQTRNPMHRAHFELTLRAALEEDANLLVHPVVGMTKPGDLDHYLRVRCYEALMHRYPPRMAKLALLPLAMRMAGPREALWHALVRKNYGCTHLIVGRDHAGPGSRPDAQPFYDPYAAQELVREHQAEIGITMVPFRNMVFVQDKEAYLPDEEVPPGQRVLDVSGTELRQRLARGHEVPAWFTFPEVLAELRRSHPPRNRQGFTVFFTGLSGAGKSTVANILLSRFLEMGERKVTLLDGDIVRKHLSSELGFSKEHRDINIRRIGFVASEITKNGGIALCAPIAPYDSVRKEVRAMIEPHGGFALVHANAPLEVCEARDRKGLYAKARAGLVANFTGVSDPYEQPADAEVVLQTGELTPEEAAQQVLSYLEREGFIGASG